MKKYFVLSILPFIASCANLKVERPTAVAAEQGELKANEGLEYPYQLVDQTATNSLDVTEDSAGFVSNISRKQTRKYAGTSVRTAGRGSRIVANETSRFNNTALDIVDDTADLTTDQVDIYPNLVLDATGRTFGVGGKLLGSGVRGYTNAVHRTSAGIFGGLFKGVFVDTKPYMVGSANDQIPAGPLPGSSWKGRLRTYEPAPAAEPAYVADTSAKAVLTSSK